jgi:hypothetical protein
MGPDFARESDEYQTRGNDEIQMTKLEGMTNYQKANNNAICCGALELGTFFIIRRSDIHIYFVHSSFFILHSSF